MTGIANAWVWAGFSIFLITALSIDTMLVKKKGARIAKSMRTALMWTLLWISLALFFNAILWISLYLERGSAIANEKALAFLTGYIIEKSLSVDNLFVFYMIFHQFHIPPAYQQRVFSYGIWGAIIMRLLLILIGSWLIIHFHWILYLMGGFLLLTGLKMFWMDDNNDASKLITNKLILFLKPHLRITHELQDQQFFIRKDTVLYATPLFLTLIFIEIADLIFALDSIPAIFAITTDPFIIWTSNIFAILGLRAMYFLLIGVVDKFYLFKYAIALILVYVGIKMIMAIWYPIPVGVSLLIIVSILIIFSMISVFYCQKDRDDVSS